MIETALAKGRFFLVINLFGRLPMAKLLEIRDNSGNHRKQAIRYKYSFRSVALHSFRAFHYYPCRKFKNNLNFQIHLTLLMQMPCQLD